MAKAQINKQDTLGSSSADREADRETVSSSSDSSTGSSSSNSNSPQRLNDSASVVSQELHSAAIDAPSHPLVVADPEHRIPTEAIPATRVGELPGPVGTAEIHGNTIGLPTRDGDLDPEGWYSGQGGITGDHTRDTVPVSEDMREAKEKRHEPLAGR